MRELIIGVIAVGLYAGVLLGRDGERVRRSRKDRTSAKATYEKSVTVAKDALKKAALTVVAVAALLAVALMIGWNASPN